MERVRIAMTIGCCLVVLGFSFSSFAADCGNAILEAGEACDDGNDADFDGCSSACLKETVLDCNGTGIVANNNDCEVACATAGYAVGELKCFGGDCTSSCNGCEGVTCFGVKFHKITDCSAAGPCNRDVCVCSK